MQGTYEMLYLLSFCCFGYKAFVLSILYFHPFLRDYFGEDTLSNMLLLRWLSLNRVFENVRCLYTTIFEFKSLEAWFHGIIYIMFMLWFVVAIRKILHDKNRQVVIRAIRQQTIERHEFAASVCNALLVAERARLFPRKRKSKVAGQRRSSCCRRPICGRKFTVLWNKLHKLHRRSEDPCEEKAAEVDFKRENEVKVCQAAASLLNNFPVDSIIPQAFCNPTTFSQSSNVVNQLSTFDGNEIEHMSLCQSNNSLNMESSLPVSDTAEVERSLGSTKSITTDLTSCLYSSSQRKSLNPCFIETEQHFIDSGYHENSSTKVFFSTPNVQACEFLRDIEAFNEMRDVQLSRRILQAQTQVKRELETIKSSFHIQKEEVEFTRSQIYNCPELKSRRMVLIQLKARIEAVAKEMKISQENCRQLSKQLQPTKDDALCQIKIDLAWEQKHGERYMKASKDIVRHVRSAMETRFRGMNSESKHKKAKMTNRNWCYDCTAGLHAKYIISGLNERIKNGSGKILSKSDGFDEDCMVVMVINSWYNDLELNKCVSMKTKADKMEALLKKVLRDMYVTRYYKRGQLLSQSYLTVGFYTYGCAHGNLSGTTPTNSSHQMHGF